MKKILCICMLCLLSFAARSQFVKAELEVSGLTCSMCSLSTQKSLKTLDFIADIKPDLNKNIFYITFKPGKVVDPESMKQKVMSAGFSVSKLVCVFKFSDLKVNQGSSYPFQGNNYFFEEVAEKTLNGETRFQIIDRDFIPGKAYKKYALEIKDAAYHSAMKEKGSHDFHVVLI